MTALKHPISKTFYFFRFILSKNKVTVDDKPDDNRITLCKGGDANE